MLLWIFLFAGLYTGVNTECMVRGRFPNDITEDCRGYTTCIATATNTFYQYNLACPPSFVYNHFDSQCSNATGYYCLPSYNCTKIGNYQNPDSTDCMSYVSCIQGLDALTARLVDCPANTVYSPIEEFCVEDTAYTCPSATPKPDVPMSEPDVSQQNATTPIPEPVPENSASAIGVNVLCASLNEEEKSSYPEVGLNDENKDDNKGQANEKANKGEINPRNEKHEVDNKANNDQDGENENNGDAYDNKIKSGLQSKDKELNHGDEKKEENGNSDKDIDEDSDQDDPENIIFYTMIDDTPAVYDIIAFQEPVKD
ncbi:hypothetical protein O0L34_g8886 [Tuta absoluta]|nr:hypothetical protein O0L34_g8886 [Tuta absoluta]